MELPDFTEARRSMVARILEGAARAPHAQRRGAFENGHRAVKASGLSEDQFFEVVICAVVGQATRQYATELAVLEEVTLAHD